MQVLSQLFTVTAITDCLTLCVFDRLTHGKVLTCHETAACACASHVCPQKTTYYKFKLMPANNKLSWCWGTALSQEHDKHTLNTEEMFRCFRASEAELGTALFWKGGGATAVNLHLKIHELHIQNCILNYLWGILRWTFT